MGQEIRDLNRALAQLTLITRVVKEIDPSAVAGLNDRQMLQVASQVHIRDDLGQWDHGPGPDGCNYTDPADNADAENGIQCSNCVFWLDGACALVDGAIDAGGLCKLWVIPDERVA